MTTTMTTATTTFFRTTWVSWHRKGKPFWILLEQLDDGAAVASAGPYASHLHLAPDRSPRQHLTTEFYRPDALPDAQQCQSAEAKPIVSRY